MKKWPRRNNWEMIEWNIRRVRRPENKVRIPLKERRKKKVKG